ncbi:hypothetical protein BpHYR1_034583 [Brachionus plicatilis]|uniref:Uncharacterized protein n=1 Tax=Brachionus plicatilis TaxID=10195 RepID=A0A3M7RGE5_BRAPC|nr:hypothetical protein BpHYR1_034583 [Brachionus plicatilis]
MKYPSLSVCSSRLLDRFELVENLHKCVEWLTQSSTPEDKLISQLFIDSFERFVTLENSKLKIKPEDYIFSKIETYWKNNSVIYGFFTTLCQSSGFGKSKACQNLSKKAFVVFCCLRSLNSDTGYPRRSYLADKLTQVYPSENLTRQNFTNYFNMFVHFLNQNESISYKEFFEKFSNGFDGSSPFDQHQSHINQELNNLELNCPQTNKLIYYQSNKPLIFPIYLLPNWDVHTNIESIRTPQDSLLFENICSFGRPLWGSLCKTKLSDKKYDQIGLRQLTSLVMKKLVGDSSKTLDQLTDNDALAILSCRLGEIRPLLTSTAQNLIAKNMAVCTYANYEENFFKIEYPSEPILANAAAFYFNKTKTFDNKTQSGLYFLVNKLVHMKSNQ